MSANVQLIRKKIEHLRRMRNYLDYSLEQTLLLMPISDWHLYVLLHGPEFFDNGSMRVVAGIG